MNTRWMQRAVMASTSAPEVENEEGLEPGEKDAGYILTCVARPRSDCTVDV